MPSGWTSFILGRPGNEYEFEVPPESMQIDPGAIIVRQRNLIGDLKKSTLKTGVPTIQIDSSYLTLAQRNQFASLIDIDDTFLSFQCRDDWQAVDQLVSVIDSTHLQLPNSSATRLSKVLVQLGLPGIITIYEIKLSGTGGLPYGIGAWGSFPWGSGSLSGDVTYDDLARIITMVNPLPDPTVAVFVTYTYSGWLVDAERLTHVAKGGWGNNRFTYSFSLTGA